MYVLSAQSIHFYLFISDLVDVYTVYYTSFRPYGLPVPLTGRQPRQGVQQALGNHPPETPQPSVQAPAPKEQEVTMHK